MAHSELSTQRAKADFSQDIRVKYTILGITLAFLVLMAYMSWGKWDNVFNLTRSSTCDSSGMVPLAPSTVGMVIDPGVLAGRLRVFHVLGSSSVV